MANNSTISKVSRKLKWYKKVIKDSIITSRYIFCLKNMKLQEKSILLQSRYGEDLGGNIFYILKELAAGYKEYKIYLAYRSDGKDFYESLLKKYQIENITLVKLHGWRYWRLLATCKYLINDVTFRVGFIKRKGQVYLNTWHGTPLKKMGFEASTNGYLFGNMQLNFLAADYLLCPNKYMSEIMVRAYKLENLFQGEIVNAGYPRNAVFFDNQRARILKEKIGLNGEQIIAYMPTWREGRHRAAYINLLEEHLEEIDKYLTDEQIFFVKLHPKAQGKIDLKAFKHIRPFPAEYETYDFLNTADCLVTDYSSIMFDFACSRKHIILFVYDEEEYLENRGLYINLDELPFTKVITPLELVNAINSGKEYQENAFIESIVEFENGSAVKNICQLLIHGEGEYQKYPVPNNGKENILIFVDNVLKNGITSSVFNLVYSIDLNKRNYFFVYKENTVKPNKDKLLEIPAEVGILSIGTIERTITELVACYLYYKRNISNNFVGGIVEECFKRNFIRYYGNIKGNCFIQFVGYGRDVLQLFLHAPKKIVFVHNDMKKEISTRKTQHENTLIKCYQRYDIVAGVSGQTVEIAKEIAQGQGNYKIVHNCFNDKQAQENALKAVEFSRDTEYVSNSPKGLTEILNDTSITKFITIGRFSPEKRHLCLIDAFDMYWQDNNDSFLIIIGGHGPLFAKTVKHVRTKACWGNVIIIKSIMNPMPILKECDLFILSSSYEGLPVVLFEAECLGIPILSTNIEGPRELLETYGGGLLVEESVEELYEGMKAFDRGEIRPLNIDLGEYNQQCIAEFESLFE